MPSFRERPVTWLFFIATTLLVAVGVTRTRFNLDDWHEGAALGIAFGPLIIVGASTVASPLNRLARGAIFVTGLLVFTVIIVSVLNDGSWSRNAAIVFLLQTAAALGALVWVTTSWIARRKQAGILPRRVPLMEFFGWTIVVAILSATLRNSDFAQLLVNPKAATAISPFFLAGFAVAIVLGAGEGRQSGKRTIFSLAFILLLCGCMQLLDYAGTERFAFSFGVLSSGLFLICRFLDNPRNNPSRESDDGEPITGIRQGMGGEGSDAVLI